MEVLVKEIYTDEFMLKILKNKEEEIIKKMEKFLFKDVVYRLTFGDDSDFNLFFTKRKLWFSLTDPENFRGFYFIRSSISSLKINNTNSTIHSFYFVENFKKQKYHFFDDLIIGDLYLLFYKSNIIMEPFNLIIRVV